MEAIIPRWEWRTFGASFGEADRRFSALEPGRVQESDEVYLLSPVTDANVKIRDGLMDIKTLEQVNVEGLERWRPVMKGKFPLPAAEVAKVCAALGVAPVSGLDAYPLAALQAELAQASRRVHAVPVHKRRCHYVVSDCSAEMVDVVADGKPIRTVAVESEDPGRVLAAVRAMSLEQFENVSYPRGLKRLLRLSA